MRIILSAGLLLLTLSAAATGFQSDELAEEEDEWTQPHVTSERPAPVLRQSVASPGEVSRSTGGSPGDAAAADRKIEFPLEHAFGDSRFTPAGVFSAWLRSTQGGQRLSKFRLARNSFSEKEQKHFENLVKTDGYYTVRVPANVINLENGYVQTSVKARCLSIGDFQERFELHMDQGFVLGISYGPKGDCPFPRPEVYPKKWPSSSQAHVAVKSSKQASRLISLVQDLGPIGEPGPDGEVQIPVEKTFWQKYWVYVFPAAMILVNLLSAMANIPQEGQGGQGGQGQAGGQGGQPRVAARRR